MSTVTATAPTKADFLAALRTEITARYSWASDAMKLDNFMAKAEQTIRTEAGPWSKDGDATAAAWASIGGRGKVTYKGLRALAD